MIKDQVTKQLKAAEKLGVTPSEFKAGLNEAYSSCADAVLAGKGRALVQGVEMRKTAKPLVTELYTDVGRITKEADRRGHTPGKNYSINFGG